MAKLTKYQRGVEWIALNDEPSLTDEESIVDLISVGLISDIFDKNPYTVANDVINYRRKHHTED